MRGMSGRAGGLPPSLFRNKGDTMEKAPQPSLRGLIAVIAVGVLVLYAALLTALAFRDTGAPAPAPVPAPPPAVQGNAAPPAPAPQHDTASPPRPVAEPLRVSPTGSVGKALGQ